MKTVKSPKGNELPLVNLKGKDYLMVAYRIQWINEAVENFTVDTKFHVLTDDQTVCQATVTIFNKDGSVIKKSTATKRETKADFNDHTEKAETAAVGRALAMLGYGTQFAIADLDEGDRIVDTPLTGGKNVKSIDSSSNMGTVLKTSSETPPKISKKESPIKETVLAAFNLLKSQGKIDETTFKAKYQGGVGLSKLSITDLEKTLTNIKTDFPELGI